MAIRPSVLFGETPVSNSAAALYTVPASTTAVITRAVVTNVTASPATLTLWLVRAAGSRADGNIIVGAAAAGQSIGAGPAEPTVLNALAGLVLNAGDAIHGLSATAAALNIGASGWTH
jgi:hypothetical protein